MGNAILFRMASGIPGSVTRESEADIEAQVLASGTPFYAYGIAGKISGNSFVPLTAVGDASAVFGFLVRPFPHGGANASDPVGVSVPPTTGIANVLKRGRISVFVAAGAGSVALGSPVYFRYATPSGAAVVGDIEGAAVASTTVAIPGAYFTGPADAAGIAEVAFNI
jgi:hypothetical protein